MGSFHYVIKDETDNTEDLEILKKFFEENL